ncbi:MAG: glycosyl transferase family 1 [Methylobacter sp.]|nr:MAG: glycosyl transferase family 1 [Methylobacter sp.]
MPAKSPKLLVFSSLFPSSVRPNAGVFIKERMFRVGRQLPVVVVSPVPWFPLQQLIRYWKPNFRPQPEPYAEIDGIEVYYPKFFSIPGFFKSQDGFFMAASCVLTLLKIRKNCRFDLIDAHFAYPDGYAASLLGRWFKVPVTITLRGTEVTLSKFPGRRQRILAAIKNASRVFAVAESLKLHVTRLGAQAGKIKVIGNGVDTEVFHPVDKLQARQSLGIDEQTKVLISIGGLVERKGFHRVLEILPELLKSYPDLVYLIVGGDSPEGNIRSRLEQQVESLGLTKQVRFLGAKPSYELKTALSAADVFVLATANEGWANVFLEAMACGLPVITTDVGGNREVVCAENLGTIVPFGDTPALLSALNQALQKQWDSVKLINYARLNSWETRVEVLVREFTELVG